MQSTTTHENATKPRKCQPSPPQAIVSSSQRSVQSYQVQVHTHTHVHPEAGRPLKMDKGEIK